MSESTSSLDIITTESFIENVITFSASDLDFLQRFDIPTPVHIICLTLILTFSLIGNTLVLYVYARKKPLNVGNIFIIAFAALDIYASIVLSPQFALMWYSIERTVHNDDTGREIMLYSFLSILFLYLGLLVSVALDRVWAVFFPFSYTQSKRRTLTIIGVEVVLSISLTVFHRVATKNTPFSKPMIGVVIIAFFFTIVGSYIAMIHRLRKNRLKVVVSSGAKNVAVNSTAKQTKTQTDRNSGLACKTSLDVPTISGNARMKMKTKFSSDVHFDEAAPSSSQQDSGIVSEETQTIGNMNAPKMATKKGIRKLAIRNRSGPGKDKGDTVNKKMIKIFAAITLLFVLSFAPCILFMFNIARPFHLMYAYFINHCGNPFVYYFLDKSFREEVKGIFFRLRFWN